MLSAAEYQRTKSLLEHLTKHPPPELTSIQRCRLRKTFRKKLKEHDYATRFTPFEPLPHIPYFINRTTTESTLPHLLQTTRSVTEFTLDTESVQMRQAPNQPVLIQLQLLLPYNLSLVLVVEMCHLPRENHICFKLLQEIFRIVFSPEKKLYIWGSKDELSSFVTFKLFTTEKIQYAHPINLQHKFKIFWHQQHPHHLSTSSTTSTNNCICEKCLGKKLSESWSLQDSVAYELNEYLSKVLTNQNFDVGLDPHLYRMNSKEIEHRQQITTYAINDCLSMQRILFQMKHKKFNFNSHLDDYVYRASPELVQPSSIDDDIFSSTPPISTHDTFIQPTDQPLSPAEHIQIDNPTYSNRIDAQPNPLTTKERRIIHNRTCTLKQRQRSYQYEIIRRNIDRRFRITDIKNILRQHNIPFSAINAPTSSLTSKRSLYIGFREGTKLRQFKHIIRDLFTTDHYHTFKHTTNQSPVLSRRYYSTNTHRKSGYF